MRFVPFVLAWSAALALISVKPASATSIVSDFESGSLDWRTTCVSCLEMIVADGPNHFMRVALTEGPVLTWAMNWSSFSGDLRDFDGGTFSYDVRLTSSPPPGHIVTGPVPTEAVYFGDITLVTGVGIFSLDAVPGTSWQATSLDWVTHSASMTAAVWGVDQTNWELALGSVDRFQISLGMTDSRFADFDNSADLDNIMLTATPVPEPTSLLLLSAGLLGLASRRRRRSS